MPPFTVSTHPHSFLSPLVRRAFSTTPHRHASILFALNALSNSRETQHFNKISHLNRIEHSPSLKLIKTSEIDPFPLPTPPPTPATPHLRLPQSSARIWDAKALKVGRAILADHARQTSRLQQALQRAKRKEARQDALMAKDRATWQQEARRFKGEMRMAGVVILLSIGTATALATWRFWPQSGKSDSGEMGRWIAAKAEQAFPMPAVVPARVSGAMAPRIADTAVQGVAPTPAAAVEPALTTNATPAAVPVDTTRRRSWWKDLFWKQQ